MKKLSLVVLLVVVLLHVAAPISLAAEDDIPWMASPSAIGVPIKQ